jgi:hypothetical protein
MIRMTLLLQLPLLKHLLTTKKLLKFFLFYRLDFSSSWV